MNLIITLLICTHAQFVIESLVQRISPYNPPWLQRFMDNQVAGNDLLAAAHSAQQFNDNLEHEVRVASDMEPIPHLGEYPTRLKMDASHIGERAPSKLEQKIQQMREEVVEDSVFKVGWQDDDQLYNRIVEHLLELDAEEQPEFLLKILKNEMRSNRTRVVKRLQEILQLIMNEDLTIPLEKLYEVCIRANMEMEIEEVFREELNISLDPIRNADNGEAEQLVEEMVFEEPLQDEQVYQTPVEYQIILRKDKRRKIQEQDEEQLTEESQEPPAEETQEPPANEIQESPADEIQESPAEESHENIVEEFQDNTAKQYPQNTYQPNYQVIVPPPSIPIYPPPWQQYSDPFISDIPYDLPPQLYNPVHEDDKYNVYGEKKSTDQYFHYIHGTQNNTQQPDVAQSINIVQGDAEMQSINIVMDPPDMQSINIQFDETQAEQNKQQELYHKYRNQKHFINRDSFRYPIDPQYPNIHTVQDPSRIPYQHQGYYTGDVPTHAYQVYEPPIEDEMVPITEETNVPCEEAIIYEGAAIGEETQIGQSEEGQPQGDEAEPQGEEAQLQGEEAQSQGEETQPQGEETQPQGEEQQLEAQGEEAQSPGEEAQVQGEETQPQGEDQQNSEEIQQTGESPGEETQQTSEETVENQQGSEEQVPQDEEVSGSKQCVKKEKETIEEVIPEEISQPRINWENVPDEILDYIVSRLVHPKFYDPYHPHYDPYDSRNIQFTQINIENIQLQDCQQSPYYRERSCNYVEDLVHQISPDEINSILHEYKRRSQLKSQRSSTYKPFTQSENTKQINEEDFQPQEPPQKKLSSNAEQFEFADDDFVTPRDIGKFGKKRPPRAENVDPNDPRALPNFNPDKSSYLGNNEYVSDNPILKTLQGSKMNQEERGDYQLQNPGEFHKPPAFNDDRPYRTGRDGKPQERDFYYDDYDDYDPYDDYLDDEGLYDDYEDDYYSRPYNNQRRRSKDGRRPYDDYEDDEYDIPYDYRDPRRSDEYRDPNNQYEYRNSPNRRRRRRRGGDEDDLPVFSDEEKFDRELRRSGKALGRSRRYRENEDGEPVVEGVHIYPNLETYNKARGAYDKRSREDKAIEDPIYAPGKKKGSPRIRDIGQEDHDDYPRRDQSKGKEEMESAGMKFAKSLKEQERKKRNKKLQEEQLKELGINKKGNRGKKNKAGNDSNSDEEKDEKKQQQKSKQNKKDEKKQINKDQKKLNKNQEADTDEQKKDKESSANEEKQQPKQDKKNYQVEGLAANKANNINSSDSLIKPQSKDTTSKEMSRANEIDEPDLKHQARANSEKSSENKEFGKEEPLLNKKAKTLLQIPDESCEYMESRTKTYTCTQCNATESYILNDDSWYLIGLAKGYKKEFHTVFKLLKQLMNPHQLYTSFGQDNRICFSSQQKQLVNVSQIVSLFQGKQYNGTLLKLPDLLMMSYFQLTFHDSKFSEFELEIDDNTKIDKAGMSVSKMHIVWMQEQMQLGYSGVINFHNVQRKFDYKYQIDQDCEKENLKLYLHFPYDYEHSITMVGQLFSQEYVSMYQAHLVTQINEPAKWVAVQFKIRGCTDLREYGLSLQ